MAYVSNNVKEAVSNCKGVLHWEGYDNVESSDEIVNALLKEHFCTRRKKLLGRSDSFILESKKGVESFSTSEVL